MINNQIIKSHNCNKICHIDTINLHEEICNCYMSHQENKNYNDVKDEKKIIKNKSDLHQNKNKVGYSEQIKIKNFGLKEKDILIHQKKIKELNEKKELRKFFSSIIIFYIINDLKN